MLFNSKSRHLNCTASLTYTSQCIVFSCNQKLCLLFCLSLVCHSSVTPSVALSVPLSAALSVALLLCLSLCRLSVCVCVCVCVCVKMCAGVHANLFQKGVAMGVFYRKKVQKNSQIDSQTCTRFSGKVGHESKYS